MERSELPPAVVVGTDITGTSLARSLAAHGITVLGVDEEMRHFTSYSRAYAEVCIVPKGFREEPFIEFMQMLSEGLPRRAVLMLSMDHHVTLLGKSRARLQDSFFFEFPEAASVALLMDKQQFAERAVQRGWTVPRTFNCDSATDVREAATLTTFPVILKPRLKSPTWAMHSWRKVYRCESGTELLTTYEAIRGWESHVIVQEWIPGGDNEVYFSLHYLAQDGAEVAGFEGHKIRQWPPQTGNTSSAGPVDSKRVSDMSLAILRDCGAVGFCAMEYKRHIRTDRFYITEPTIGRVNLQIATATANGVDIPGRAYFHLTSLRYPEPDRPDSRQRIWIHLRSDLRSARHYVRNGELTWLGYLKSISGTRHFAAWHWLEYKMMAALFPAAVYRVVRFARNRLRKIRLPRKKSRPSI